MSRSGATPAIVLCVVLIIVVMTRVTAHAEGPYLGVSPNPTTDRQVTAFGSEFCGAPGCSKVTIVIDDRIVASEIQVGPDGTFEAALMAPEVAGEYVVTASQRNAEGKLISAQAPLTVMAIDYIEPTVLPPTPAPSPPGSQATQVPTPTGSPPAEPSPTPSEHAPPSPTPGDSGGGGTATPTPPVDRGSESGDGGTSPWLLAAIGAAVAAAVVSAALGLRRVRRR